MGSIVLQHIRNSWAVLTQEAAREKPESSESAGPPEKDPPAADVSADAGMSTVEYAVGTVVAAAFAAVLYRIVTGDSVIAGLTNLINTALNTSF
jgi:hypothetical protein